MIEFLAQLDWRAPWWGLLALQPALIWLLARQRRQRLAGYADAHLLPWAVVGSAQSRPALWPRLAQYSAWLLLAAAAAGPRLPLPDAAGANPAPSHRLNVEIVLDLSASMSAADIAPTRLERAHLELNDWLDRLHGERVGIVVYAGDAGVLLPPSDDVALVRRALQQAHGDLLAQPGSNLAAALDLAARQLHGARGNAILLVTDAEVDSLAGSAGEAARAAAQRLRQAGIPLFVLGVGTAAGAPIPLPQGGYAERDGVQVISRSHAGGYDDLARAGGGRFSRVQDGDGDWAALHDNGIAALPGDPLAPERIRAWQELYAWCLAPALGLLLAGGGWPRKVRHED